MNSIKNRIDFEVQRSSDNMAKLFISMSSKEKAYFFNSLGTLAYKELRRNLEDVDLSGYLSDEGRYAMGLMGDHAE